VRDPLAQILRQRCRHAGPLSAPAPDTGNQNIRFRASPNRYNALITSSGECERHYIAAIFSGLLAITFGLMAPAFTGLMLAAPKEYIMMLGGLAMLRVLQAAFIVSFKDHFTFGALIKPGLL
jgi:predicted benzoate:H+ symporter BenE